jgi:hypothetical protein
VTAWTGSSARIAVKHYLHVTDADFDRATGQPTASAENPASRA